MSYKDYLPGEFLPGQRFYNNEGGNPCLVRIVELADRLRGFYLIKYLEDQVSGVNYGCYNHKKGNLSRVHKSWLLPVRIKCQNYLKIFQQ